MNGLQWHARGIRVVLVRQRGVSLIITLIMFVVLTLTAISVSRVTRTALSVNGNLGQAQMLAMSNDIALALAKQALQATAGVITPAAVSQPWYNTSSITMIPDEHFWQTCTSAGGTPTSCASTTQNLNGQSVTVQYLVRVTPYTYQFPTTTSGGGQLTATYYQMFTNVTTPDGAAASAEAWYLN